MKKTVWAPRWALVAMVVSAMLAAGCGDDGGDSPAADAAATVDASTATNALGVRCGPSLDPCPTGHTCVVQGVPGGDTMQGYCSPTCNTDPDCTTGYGGPGRATCFSNNECTIVCTDACPTDLSCLATGGPTSVCAVPMQ